MYKNLNLLNIWREKKTPFFSFNLEFMHKKLLNSENKSQN